MLYFSMMLGTSIGLYISGYKKTSIAVLLLAAPVLLLHLYAKAYEAGLL